MSLRRNERTKIVRPAKWLSKEANACCACVVVNFDAQNACVSFDAADYSCLPTEFELSFDNFHTGWLCHVVWQGPGVADVEWRPLN